MFFFLFKKINKFLFIYQRILSSKLLIWLTTPLILRLLKTLLLKNLIIKITIMVTNAINSSSLDPTIKKHIIMSNPQPPKFMVNLKSTRKAFPLNPLSVYKNPFSCLIQLLSGHSTVIHWSKPFIY